LNAIQCEEIEERNEEPLFCKISLNKKLVLGVVDERVERAQERRGEESRLSCSPSFVNLCT
jgi:hypothetical protein